MALDSAPIGVLDVRPDGVVMEINERAATLLDVSVSDAPGKTVIELFPASVEDTVPAAFDGAGIDAGETEEYYPEPECWLSVTITELDDHGRIFLQDVTASYRDQQRIEQLRGDLDRLTITNTLISDILGELVEASSRTEIAETICERLGETDIYEFAWVGERELGGDGLVVQAASGTTGRTLEEIRKTLGSERTLPEQEAIERNEPTVVQPLGENHTVPESIRRAAFADGLQSLLTIPLSYGSSVYGVVGIYSSDQDAFSEREQSSFGTVGEMAGFAINASRQRNLLLSDTVVEIRLEITDSAAPFVRATATGGSVELSGVVAQGSDLYCYLTVEGTDPEAVAATIAETPETGAVRLISDHDDGGALEVVLDEQTPLGMLSAQGVTIAHAEYSDSRGECLIELSPNTDVRRVVEAVTREYDGTVLSKRQQQRDIRTKQQFETELRERLTDRQETALRTAFFADYFESPRGSTAEEVATAMGITGPTLLHHLRAGQRKLLSEFFETGEHRPGS